MSEDVSLLGEFAESVPSKQARSLDTVTCPDCGVRLVAPSLLAHVESRCRGRRVPDRNSKWVTWSGALSEGVTRATLSSWVKLGFVRSRGQRADRQYLLLDLVMEIARRRYLRKR